MTGEDLLYDVRWAWIPGFEGIAKMYVNGEVWTVDRKVPAGPGESGGARLVKGQRLKPHMNSDGYPRLILRRDHTKTRILIHRVLAQIFIPVPDHLPKHKPIIVNHKDANRGNYNLGNLEWMTKSQNNKHYWNRRLERNLKLLGVG